MKHDQSSVRARRTRDRIAEDLPANIGPTINSSDILMDAEGDFCVDFTCCGEKESNFLLPNKASGEQILS